jgi:hypothetical protein
MKDNGTMTRPRHRRRNQESQILAIKLTHEEIARRAYQLYEDRGGEHGHDLQDWFQAERELREFLRDAAGKVLNRTGFFGGPIRRDDGTHGTTQLACPGGT